MIYNQEDKFYDSKESGIRAILELKDKEYRLFGDGILQDGVVYPTYKKYCEYHKHDSIANASFVHDFVSAPVDLRSIPSGRALSNRIEKQRKVAKSLYKMRHLPDAIAFKISKDSDFAIVMISTPYNAEKYSQRCWTLGASLNGKTAMKTNIDLKSFQLPKANYMDIPKLTDDIILYKAVSEAKNKIDVPQQDDDEVQLPSFDSTPKSMQEFFSRLELVGYTWHQINDQVDKDNIKPAKMSDRTTLDLLEHYVDFYHLYSPGDDLSALDQTPIWFMDYDKRVYQTGDTVIGQMLQAINRNIIKRSRRSDLIDTLRADRAVKKHVLTRSVHPELVAMGNGIYNLKDHSFRKYNLQKDFFASKTSINYNPEAKTEPTFDISTKDGKHKQWKLSRDWFELVASDSKGILDTTKLKLLYQVVFLAMIGASNTRKVVFCINDGQSGTSKSTYIELCEAMVGEGNYASVNVPDWSNPTAMHRARGKNLLAGDDYNANSLIYDYSAFKNIASDGPVLTKLLYSNPYSVPLHVFAIQAANGLPSFRDPDNAVLSRIRVIRFDHFFGVDNAHLRIVKDRFIHDPKLLEWLACKVLSMFDYYNSLSVIDTEESRHEVRSLGADQDSLNAFIADHLDDLKSRRIPAAMMYGYYYNVSLAEGFAEQQILTKRKFIKQFTEKQSTWKYYSNNKRVEGLFNSDDTTTYSSAVSRVPSPKQREYKIGVRGFRGAVFENESNSTPEEIHAKARQDGEDLKEAVRNGTYQNPYSEYDVKSAKSTEQQLPPTKPQPINPFSDPVSKTVTNLMDLQTEQLTLSEKKQFAKLRAEIKWDHITKRN